MYLLYIHNQESTRKILRTLIMVILEKLRYIRQWSRKHAESKTKV